MLAHLAFAFVIGTPIGGVPVELKIPFATMEACEAFMKDPTFIEVSIPLPAKTLRMECVNEPLKSAAAPT